MANKMLNFRNLLKIETALSLVISLFFMSFKITGFSIYDSSNSNAGELGIFFFIFALIGLAGLLYARKNQ